MPVVKGAETAFFVRLMACLSLVSIVVRARLPLLLLWLLRVVILTLPIPRRTRTPFDQRSITPAGLDAHNDGGRNRGGALASPTRTSAP